MRQWTRAGVAFLALAVLLGGIWVTGFVRGAPARTAAASDFDQSRRISVTGTAEIFVTPNMGQLVVGIQSEGQTASEAQQKGDAVMSAVVTKLLALGIKQTDLKTVGLNLYPIYDYRPYESKEPPSLTPIGFRSNQRLQVIVRDLAKVGTVIDQSVLAGANSIEDITYSLSDTAEVRKQALGKAVGDAKAKADAIAQAMGVRVLEITSVQEQGIDYGFYKSPMMERSYLDGAGSAMAMPGEIAVRVSIGMVVRY